MGQLPRSLDLKGAVALNMLDMIGVGPFITLPLMLAAMGGPQAMLGWVRGAGLSCVTGWCGRELGAAMPEAGGSYAFLRRTLFRAGWTERSGEWLLAFLFLFQLLFLRAAVGWLPGASGWGSMRRISWPGLAGHTTAHGAAAGWRVHGWYKRRAGYAGGDSSGSAGGAAAVSRAGKPARGCGRDVVRGRTGLIAWILVTGAMYGSLRQGF